MNIRLDRNKEFPYSKDIPFFLFPDFMITSKLTSKSQTTIPQPIRQALGLIPGDRICYSIEGDKVILSRSETDVSVGDPFEFFSEWQGKEDEEAYADL